MIKIFCFTKELGTGASIPRVNSIKHLEETGYPVQVVVGTYVSEVQLKWADIVMIHRPEDESHLKVARMTKDLNKKLWVDMDDDLLSIPIDHANFMNYSHADRKGWIRESCKLADLVTISNPQILESFRSLNKNIHYYPCAYDERLMPEPDYSERNKVVLWRGSNSHEKSMVEFAPAIAELDKQFTGWEFIFVGAYPWQMIEKIKNNSWHCHSGYMPTEILWDYARKLKPAIQMVCLTDNQFTRSRSNMAMMDATIAGSVTVARDYPHFRTPGVETYKATDEFIDVMSNFMQAFERSPNDSNHLIYSSWDYIQAHQTFKAINVKQMELINSLFNGSKE